jgi:hypothetical protein
VPARVHLHHVVFATHANSGRRPTSHVRAGRPFPSRALITTKIIITTINCTCAHRRCVAAAQKATQRRQRPLVHEKWARVDGARYGGPACRVQRALCDPFKLGRPAISAAGQDGERCELSSSSAPSTLSMAAAASGLWRPTLVGLGSYDDAPAGPAHWARGPARPAGANRERTAHWPARPGRTGSEKWPGRRIPSPNQTLKRYRSRRPASPNDFLRARARLSAQVPRSARLACAAAAVRGRHHPLVYLSALAYHHFSPPFRCPFERNLHRPRSPAPSEATASRRRRPASSRALRPAHEPKAAARTTSAHLPLVFQCRPSTMKD